MCLGDEKVKRRPSNELLSVGGPKDHAVLEIRLSGGGPKDHAVCMYGRDYRGRMGPRTASSRIWGSHPTAHEKEKEM